MKCPMCKLLNPPSAQRCDCGYDFDSKTVEKPYQQTDAGAFSSAKSVLFVVALIHLLNAAIGLARGIGVTDIVVFQIVWLLGFLLLYTNFTSGRNWARVALAIWTFPLGFVLFSHRVKSSWLTATSSES